MARAELSWTSACTYRSTYHRRRLNIVGSARTSIKTVVTVHAHKFFEKIGGVQDVEGDSLMSDVKQASSPPGKLLYSVSEAAEVLSC